MQVEIPPTKEGARLLMDHINAAIDSYGFECKGICEQTCVPVTFCNTEWEPVKDKGVDRLTLTEFEKTSKDLDKRRISGERLAQKELCGFLDHHGRCKIYINRPLVCRIFGITDHPVFRCPHGCKPLMTIDQVQELLSLYNHICNIDGSFKDGWYDFENLEKNKGKQHVSA